jgi:RNA polymerase-binding transcription factor DksA
MDTNYFKTKLEEEKTKLERELSRIARRDPQNPEDWKTKPEDYNIIVSDKNELADTFEESANKEALEVELEDRLNFVNEALKKIEENKYGVCEAGGCPIEKKRLEADPAAKTCIKHSGRV